MTAEHRPDCCHDPAVSFDAGGVVHRVSNSSIATSRFTKAHFSHRQPALVVLSSGSPLRDAQFKYGPG
jgi:hypothetical protein